MLTRCKKLSVTLSRGLSVNARVDWACYGTPSHEAAENISGKRLLGRAASFPCLRSVLPHPRGLSAVWRRRCDRVRPPHARLVTRRELVTKIDASTNNPEGNWASGRMDDSILLRPAWVMFHILRTTFVEEKKQLIYYGLCP